MVPSRLTLLTCAASSTSVSAETSTVAGCPTATLPMSASVRGTTRSIEDRSTISISGVLELDPEPEDPLPDEPVPAAALAPLPLRAAPPVALAADELEAPVELAELDWLPADTVSPTCTSATDATTPDAGAYSLVSATVCSAVCTSSWAAATLAWADVTLAASVAALGAVDVWPAPVAPAFDCAAVLDRVNDPVPLPDVPLPDVPLPEAPPPLAPVDRCGRAVSVTVVVVTAVVGAEPVGALAPVVPVVPPGVPAPG